MTEAAQKHKTYALREAVNLNDIDAVKELLRQGVDVDERNDFDGLTALMLASMRGDMELARLLLENDADVNIKASGGTTAFIFAASSGHTELASLLLEEGAEINEKDNLGCTALILAAISGSTEAARFLIRKGAEINAKDILGYTAQMQAEKRGHTEITQMLQEAAETRQRLIAQAENKCLQHTISARKQESLRHKARYKPKPRGLS